MFRKLGNLNPFRKTHYSFSQEKLPPQLVRPGSERWVGGWLFLTAAGCLGMIVLGGYTRLTHSGLSMVEWKPYTGRYPRN